MIPIVFNGNPAFMLDDVPDWGRADVVVEPTIPSSYERGLTGRETRRNTGDTLRLAVKWTSVICAVGALNNLRNSLQALAQQPILCPFWPGGFVAGAQPLATTQFYALFNADGTFNSIQPSAAQPFAQFAYPLLVGILAEIPDPPLLNAVSAIVNFSFAENDNTYFLTPPPLVIPMPLRGPAGDEILDAQNKPILTF